MGCKKFFHCINLNILISQVYEFCERWYMRHRWPWCINSEKKDLIAALTRWLFWGFFCNLSILRQTKPPHMWPGQWGCLQYASALWGQAFAVRGNPCSRLVCTGSTACVHPRTVHRAVCSACALDFWSPASRECGWKSWTATGTRGQCVGQTCFFPSHPPGSFVSGWAFTVSNHNYVFNRLDATEC